jgi:hypothetical protein
MAKQRKVTNSAGEKMNQINLRVAESLQRRLENAARQRGTSLNNEMRVRLEESFEIESLRSVNDVATDMAYHWSRFAERFLLLDLASEMVTAAEAGDFEKVRVMAGHFRKSQEAATRQRKELNKVRQPEEEAA